MDFSAPVMSYLKHRETYKVLGRGHKILLGGFITPDASVDYIFFSISFSSN